MRPVVVVVVTVIFCQYLHLLQIGKHLPVQELVSHAAYERLRVSVLPRSTGLDVESFDSRTRQPTLYGFGHELGTIVRVDEARCSSLGEQAAQSLYHRDSALIERSVCSARHSLLYSSTMGIIFSLRPSSVASIAKS